MLDHVVFYSQWGSIGGGGRPNLGGGVVGSGGACIGMYELW